MKININCNINALEGCGGDVEGGTCGGSKYIQDF